MNEVSHYLGGIIAILLLTSFVKILTTLTILRVGVGLQQSGFGIVIIAVSLALSLVIMSPQLTEMGGVNALLNGTQSGEAINYEQKFRPFLDRHSAPELKERLKHLANENKEAAQKAAADQAPAAQPVAAVKTSAAPFEILVSAFLLTELKEAFQIGAIILIPFLVIDLLVANILMLLGAIQISPELISLPLKIILFFAVDGWALLAEKLMRAYI